MANQQQDGCKPDYPEPREIYNEHPPTERHSNPVDNGNLVAAVSVKVAPNKVHDYLADDGCLKASAYSSNEEVTSNETAGFVEHPQAALDSFVCPPVAKPTPVREFWMKDDLAELGSLVDNLQLGEIVKLHAVAQESCGQVGPVLPMASALQISMPVAVNSMSLLDVKNELWDVESKMELHDGAFSLVRHLASHLDMGMGLKMRRQASSQWRQRFHLGPKLGDGAQASVYKATAVGDQGLAMSVISGVGCGGDSMFGPGIASACSSLAPKVCSDCINAEGREVAVKLFHKPRSPAFQKELAALVKIGAHPHVVRLLESYQNDMDEDVIILELFDCDLYELYRQWFYHMSALLDRLIARIVSQLLHALDYLITRGVAHRDIKLENIMIYQMNDLEAVELKLGDFGWAGLADSNGRFEKAPKVCGTLWYSPPECSPPISRKTDSRAPLDPERSDMWSVGVVAYLLHVGQNPFKSFGNGVVQDEHEALHRAASGSFDVTNSRWRRLPEDVRDFIQRLLRVVPSERPTPREALNHTYLRKAMQEFKINIAFISARSRRQRVWSLLDGFQRLAWLAMARAVSETEIDKELVAGALHLATTSGTESSASYSSGIRYLAELAMELASMPFRGSAWEQIILLAFRYIDIDADGSLGTKDLARHLCSSYDSPRCRPGRTSIFTQTSDAALAIANIWITRWRSNKRERALGVSELRKALFAHRSPDGTLSETPRFRPSAAPAPCMPPKVG